MVGIYLDGYMSYRLWMAISLHFKQDCYNIFENKGRVNCPRDKFDLRNDKAFFHAVGGEYRKGDLANFYMANIMAGCTHISEYTDINFREWKSKIHRIDYIFEGDLKKLEGLAHKHSIKFNDLFISKTGGLPIAIQLLNGGHINIETICLIDNILGGGIMLRFDEQIRDRFVWTGIRSKILKYQPWIKTDEGSLKQLLIKYSK